jgi:hypothetical protein
MCAIDKETPDRTRRSNMYSVKEKDTMRE